MKRMCVVATSIVLFMLWCIGGIASAQSTASDDIVFFLPDRLGSAVAAANESGDLCWTETYSPYGDKSINDDTVAGLGMPPGCGMLGEERGFTGHTEDFESDLVYAQQRYYDPDIGRFLSVDPAAIDPLDVRTINRYSYAANNPYRFTDPTGEFFTPETILDGTSLFIGGVSFFSNLFSGNYVDAGVDGIGVIIDAGALVLPVVPGGAGLILQGSRKGIAEKSAEFTFRGDSRSADEIFSNGFKPRGSSTDLQAHALDNTSPASAFVSTSKSPKVASEFADNVFVVRPRNGVDVNKTLGSKSPFPDELEIAIPGGVAPTDIRAVTTGNISILNPNFRP